MSGTDSIKGVWYQPIGSLGHLKSLGFNTMFGLETEDETRKIPEVIKALRDNGMGYVVQQSRMHEVTIVDASLRAITLADEPDQDNTSSSHISPDGLVQLSNDVNKLYPGIPQHVNFDGYQIDRISGRLYDYQKALSSPWIKWVSYDKYVYNRGLSGQAAIDSWLSPLHFLLSIAPNKRVFPVLELSYQHIDKQPWTNADPLQHLYRGPTGTEVLAMISAANTLGVNDFLGFPDRIGVYWEAFWDVATDVEAAVTQAWGANGHTEPTQVLELRVAKLEAQIALWRNVFPLLTQNP